MKILVIGACNIDIIGTSKSPLITHESNIGEVKISLGGVAKNIATNLHYLGSNISFMTLIGNDNFSVFQENELRTIGLDYSKSLCKSTSSSTYLAIHDSAGDLDVAINDMRAFEDLDKSDFELYDNYIETFDVLVFDTNLSEAALIFLIEKYKYKIIYVDGVSQTKVVRIRKVLQYIDLLKINQYELNALLNLDMYDIIKGIEKLIDLGLENCIVSSSNEPIIYNIKSKIYQSLIHEAKSIKSTMGAGDALFSGVIFSLLNNKSMHDAINFGKLVALKTLEVYEASNRDIKQLINL